jgi:hypothetical protein
MARKRSSGLPPAGSDTTDGTETTDTSHESRTSPAASENVAEDLGRTAEQFSMMVRSPLFAYGLAALLAIPAFLYFTQAPEADDVAVVVTPTVAAPAASGSRMQIAELPDAPVEPRARAVLLLQRYEHALRDRDLEELREYWEMSPEQEKDMADLFRDARIVSPLVDLQQIEPRGDDGMLIAFAQVLTLVRGAGQFYARGPTVYRAEVVRAPGFDAWMLRDVQEVSGSKPAAPVGRED